MINKPSPLVTLSDSCTATLRGSPLGMASQPHSTHSRLSPMARCRFREPEILCHLCFNLKFAPFRPTHIPRVIPPPYVKPPYYYNYFLVDVLTPGSYYTLALIFVCIHIKHSIFLPSLVTFLQDSSSEKKEKIAYFIFKK